MTLYEIIAKSGKGNQSQADKINILLAKYGLTPATTIADAEKKIAYIIQKYKEGAIKQLMEIHPHKEAILSFCGCSGAEGTEEKSNCCGADGGEQQSNCNGNAQCKKCAMADKSMSNAEGDTKTSDNKITDLIKGYLPITLIGVFFLLGLNMVLKSK